MSQSEQQKRKQKVVQYLNEAHAIEHALVRVLQSQIAMTPRGSYRTGLERHLGETRDHAERVGQRLQALGDGTPAAHVRNTRRRLRRCVATHAAGVDGPP